MLLVFLLGRVLLGLLLFGGAGRLGGGIGIAAKELVQQGECGGLAVNFVLVVILVFVPLAEHTAHLVAEQVQIVLGNAHLLYRLVNLGNAQTPGALEAVALIHGDAVFDLRDEHNGNILFTFAAHFRLHTLHSSSGDVPFFRSIAQKKRKRENKL